MQDGAISSDGQDDIRPFQHSFWVRYSTPMVMHSACRPSCITHLCPWVSQDLAAARWEMP